MMSSMSDILQQNSRLTFHTRNFKKKEFKLILVLLVVGVRVRAILRFDTAAELCVSDDSVADQLMPLSASMEVFDGRETSLRDQHCDDSGVLPSSSRLSDSDYRHRVLNDAVLLITSRDATALTDECAIFEHLFQPLMHRRRTRWRASTTLVVSQRLFAFIEQGPVRNALVRTLFANVVSISEVKSISRVELVDLHDKLLLAHDDNVFAAFLNSLEPDSSSKRDAGVEYDGLQRGGGGKNLLNPPCTTDECSQWRLTHLDRRATDTSDAVTIEVIMLSDAAQRRWAERSAAINRHRAHAAGWQFTSYNQTLDASRAVAWSKVAALQRHVDRALARDARSHWVLWLDADAFIELDGTQRVETLVRHAASMARDVVMPADPPVWHCQNLCTGVMLWHASAWSAQFLRDWWRDAETRFGGTFKQSFSWEQRVINALWHDVASHIYVVPYCVLNAPCSSAPRSGAAVVHCMGADASTRIARLALQEDAQRTAAASDTHASDDDNDDGGVLVIGDALPPPPDGVRVTFVTTRTSPVGVLRTLLQRWRIVVAFAGEGPLVAALLRVTKRANTDVVDVRTTSMLSAHCRRATSDAGRQRRVAVAPLDWSAVVAA
jgi:hypothetical protein